MKTTQKRELKALRIPAIWCFTVGLFFCVNLAAWCQTSTVVIAEVMYDHPLYDNETVKTGHMGEFMSLYNYGEEDVDISGWRIEITDLMVSPQKKYNYTIPSQTILQESSVAIIASRPSDRVFDVLDFYEVEISEETDENILLYTSDLAFPDTRSQIRIYDNRNRLQDELIYDGKSGALPNEPLLCATNQVNSRRPIKETVSIQRKAITIDNGKHIIARINYFLPTPETVKLFAFVIDELSYISNSSTLTDPPLSLSGIVTGNQSHTALNIESSQAIKNGNVLYLAGESIILEPGFEVQSGAEFTATIEPDSFHHVKIMTYNLKGNHTDYKKHGQVVKKSKADIVAIQEVRGIKNFKKLKKESGYKGNRCLTIGIVNYGIGILWNAETIGSPIAKSYNTIWTWSLFNDREKDLRRAYMVAEFQEFCFVSTHYSLDKPYRQEMTDSILSNKLVRKCQQTGKPIYIAGDMNEHIHDKTALSTLENAGFELLNNKDFIKDLNKNYHYADSTKADGAMIDLIYEYNKNPHHKTIERGVPIPASQRKQFFENISDHLPYRVRVKIK